MNHYLTTFLAVILLAGLPACCGGKRNRQKQTTKTTADANAAQIIELNPAPQEVGQLQASTSNEVKTNIDSQTQAQTIETAIETTLAAVPTNIVKF